MGEKKQDDNPEMGDEEKLRMENEIEKLKLSAQYGAKFSEGEDKLPPEVESEWLKYIIKFEDQFENAEQITVAERLGKPVFPSPDNLNGKQIEQKLDEVLKLMAENGLFLDVICEEPPEKIYRFIIEELFEHEIDDIQIEGMATNFIYEEFHPNDKLDIEETITHFFIEMLSDDFRDHLDLHLAEKCKSTDNTFIPKEKAVEKALKFCDLYDYFETEYPWNFQIEINEEAVFATVRFKVDYQAVSESGKVHHIGPATASMRRGELGYWNIEALSMPGFSI